MRNLLVLSLLFVGMHLQATHLLNSNIELTFIGRTGPGQINRIFMVKVTAFKDCFHAQADFDDPLLLGIFDASNDSLIANVQLNLNLKMQIPNFQIPDFCIEEAIYQKQIIVQQNFYVSVSRCCRPENILNVLNEQGSSIYSEATDPLLGSGIPGPTYIYPVLARVGVPTTVDESSMDTTADSTIYELSAALQGGDLINVKPNPLRKPFIPITFKPGYSITNLLGASNSISINKYTGLLSLLINTTGAYSIGIAVKKYKAGMIMYKQVRELTIYSCLNCFMLGLNPKQQEANSLKIIPNPASEYLMFNQDFSTENNPTELSIYNATGILIRKIQGSNNSKINIDDLPAGMYFLVFSDGGKPVHLSFSKL